MFFMRWRQIFCMYFFNLYIFSPVARVESPYCFAVSPSSLEREDMAMRARAEAESSPWSKSRYGCANTDTNLFASLNIEM